MSLNNEEATDLFGVLGATVHYRKAQACREIRGQVENTMGNGESRQETILFDACQAEPRRPEGDIANVSPGDMGMTHSDPLLRELSGIRNALSRIADALEKQPAQKKSKPRKTDTGYTNEFEKFWWLYPRKVKKPEAFKAWKKLSDQQRQTALKVMPVWAKAWKDTDTRYIPHASSWLNAYGFNDPVEQAVPAQPKAEPKTEQEWLAAAQEKGINTVGLTLNQLKDRVRTS